MKFSIEIFGLIGAILTTSGFVPQLYKTLKTKSVKGISLTMYLVLFIGILFWLTYGLLIQSFSIILANTVSGILVFLLIIFKIKYKNQN